MTDYKFEFVTGCPGSGWSAISHQVKKTLSDVYDTSDNNDNCCFTIPDEFYKKHTKIDPLSLSVEEKTTHYGSYFGPSNKYGEKFDCIAKNYTVDEFTQECLRPFDDASKPVKQIKSHWFAYNLDWIWENFKGHEMLLIWKDPVVAYQHWKSFGGWKITYPHYAWYQQQDGMQDQIHKEVDLVLDFIHRKNLRSTDCNGSWMNTIYTEFFDCKEKFVRHGVKISRTIIR